MSNKKHPECILRIQASDAKKRLSKNEYNIHKGPLAPPKNISPSQRDIYLKLCNFLESGTTVINPIQQLVDTEKLSTLSHDERQRYIIQLSADYVSMKTALDANIKKSNFA